MFKFGWKKELPDHRDFSYALTMKAVELPVKVDLRDQMSPVENQGNIGSCVANATVGALEFLQIQALKDPAQFPTEFATQVFEDMSRLFVYYNARYLDGAASYDAGTYVRSAMKAIKKWGVCRESVWPYNPNYYAVAPSPFCYTEGALHQVVSYYKIDNQNLFDLKTCISSGYPIVFGMSVFSSFNSKKVAVSGVVTYPMMHESMQGGHSMLIVGYDDSKQAFIVKNSWGASWGDHGYCTIPYAYLTNTRLADDFWTIRKN